MTFSCRNYGTDPYENGGEAQKHPAAITVT
jgi:hypothetical protein